MDYSGANHLGISLRVQRSAWFDRILISCSECLISPPLSTLRLVCLACGLMYCSPTPHTPAESSARARLVPESAKHPIRCEKGRRGGERRPSGKGLGDSGRRLAPSDETNSGGRSLRSDRKLVASFSLSKALSPAARQACR